MSARDAFYVLSALGAVGAQVTVLAGPLASLSHAEGARARVVRLGRPQAVVVRVHGYAETRSQ